MSRIITRALALLAFMVLGLGFATEPAQAFKTKVLSPWTSLAITATANSASFSTLVGPTNVFGGDFSALSGDCMVWIFADHQGGTSPTLTPAFQGSFDGGTTWTSLVPLNEAGAVTAWTAVTTTDTTQLRHFKKPIPPLVRVQAALGGTSPSYIVTGKILLSE